MTHKPKPSDKAAPRFATVNEHIGRELRALFDGVVAEPVPEKFRQLLEQLERKRAKS
jgi:hypothetical protein